MTAERPSRKRAGQGARRPRRSDAVRNRERVLEAAEEVFAAKGVTASTGEIARAAGVGIGTVFRHFPTKEALLEAVFVGRLRELTEQAESLSDSDDPGTAFFDFLTGVVERSASKNAYIDALSEAGVDVETLTAEAGKKLRRALETLLIRAQTAGAVRSDIEVSDVIAMLVGISRAVEHSGSNSSAKSRMLAVVIDGLRAGPN